MKKCGVSLTLTIGLASHAFAADRSCWDIGNFAGPPRPELTCTALTEKTLFSLKRATSAAARSIMEAPGIPLSNGLHYLSNHLQDDGGYSGDVNLTFDDTGRVSIIDADVDRPGGGQIRFLWNADLGGCSDFPGSQRRCAR